MKHLSADKLVAENLMKCLSADKLVEEDLMERVSVNNSANLHPSPACVHACWPAELLQTSRRFVAKWGLKASQNRPETGPELPEYDP